MPVAIVEVVPDGDDLRAPAKIIAQTQRTVHQLQLKEVIRPAVISVQQQPVGHVRLELQLQGPVEARVPFTELGVGVLFVEHEREVPVEGDGQEAEQYVAHRPDVIRAHGCRCSPCGARAVRTPSPFHFSVA